MDMFLSFYALACVIFVLAYVLCYVVIFGMEVFDFVTQYRFFESTWVPAIIVGAVLALPLAWVLKTWGGTMLLIFITAGVRV